MPMNTREEYAAHIAQKIAEGLWGFEDVLPIVTAALTAQAEASEEKGYPAWVNSPPKGAWERIGNAILNAAPQIPEETLGEHWKQKVLSGDDA